MAKRTVRTTTQKKTGRSKAKASPSSAHAYEVKLVLLVLFTLVSILSLHTTMTGSLGNFLKGVYFGLFSLAAYVAPYGVFALIFIWINPNLKAIKKPYTAGIVLLFLSITMTITLLSGLDLLQTSPYSTEGIKNAYQMGYQTGMMKINVAQGTSVGGGLIGTVITFAVLKALGLAGSIIVILLMCFMALIFMTRMTMSTVLSFLGITAVKTKDRVVETGKNVIQNTFIPSPSAEAAVPQDDRKQNIIRLMKNNNFESHDFKNYTPEPEVKLIKKTVKPFIKPTAETKVPIPVVGEAAPVADDSEKEEIQIFDFAQHRREQSDIPIVEERVVAPVAASIDKPVIKATAKAQTAELSPQDILAVESTIQESVEQTYENYLLPPREILTQVKHTSGDKDRKDILMKARILEDTLSSFGVEAKVVQVSKGPAITRFELQPSPGVKVSRIVNLADDIALNLAASQVRIVAPIPGKAAVGIEVPNKTTALVGLRELIESKEFEETGSKLKFALGQDISGLPIIADLQKMPHLLIAGATGSGKSVCINTIITSILYTAKPDEVKFLMIDPKVVELNIYNGIPHLILPVVTDPKKAAIALNWAVNEMTERYKRFAEVGVRDIKGFNKKQEEAGNKKPMPQIVVIIDELADLMIVAPNAVEDAICRLAQMARAAGIHLIVATQRPSVDVITGVIKANIPSRIAFAVSSQVDSRTILDIGGAEKLLGKGDMLYNPVGASKPQRVQGAFISDEEVESVTQYVKGQFEEIFYDDDILEDMTLEQKEEDDSDAIIKEAIQFVIDTQKASASLLQRRFRIGYNRAARLIDELEARRIIGQTNGSKPREVLLTKEEYYQMMQDIE
jgi:S-DNA-T family DNA segregation ATPase FtsK/SpoIIIE